MQGWSLLLIAVALSVAACSSDHMSNPTPAPTSQSFDFRLQDIFAGKPAAPTTPMDLQAPSGDARLFIAERGRSEEHTSELQSLRHLVCRLLLEQKKHMT